MRGAIITLAMLFVLALSNRFASSQEPNGAATNQPPSRPNLNTLPPQSNQSAIPAVNPNTSPMVDLSGLENLPLPAGSPKPRITKIEEYKAKRIPVYPNDPESAWWEINVRHSFSQAQREMKLMMLLFTADWNTNAMGLSKEVFATKSFNEYVKKNLVICYLNYPENYRDAPKSMRWAKEEFKVNRYPNVLIFSPKGEIIRAIPGYKLGRPVDYFNDLKEACAPALSDIETLKSSLVRKGYREWKSQTGRVLFAKFMRRDDRLMTLRDGRGQEWTVKIDQLIEEDQNLARSFPRIDKLIPRESQ